MRRRVSRPRQSLAMLGCACPLWARKECMLVNVMYNTGVGHTTAPQEMVVHPLFPVSSFCRFEECPRPTQSF